MTANRSTKILVTGATGQVGSEIVAELERRNDARARAAFDVVAAAHADCDVADRGAVLGVVTALEPDIVIHPAAFTAVDACETEVERAFAVNALGTRYVAEAAALVSAHVCYLSTDYVFDGTSAAPYREWDDPNPMSVYGRSKLAGERALDAASTIVRTSWVCGRSGANMAKTVLRLLAQPGTMRFVDDQRGSPTVASDLAAVVVDLALDRARGVFHATNGGATTWFGFATAVAELAGEDPARIEPIMTADLDPPRPAPRPANSVLANAALAAGGWPALRDWRDATADLVRALTR